MHADVGEATGFSCLVPEQHKVVAQKSNSNGLALQCLRQLRRIPKVDEHFQLYSGDETEVVQGRRCCAGHDHADHTRPPPESMGTTKVVRLGRLTEPAQ